MERVTRLYPGNSQESLTDSTICIDKCSKTWCNVFILFNIIMLRISQLSTTERVNLSKRAQNYARYKIPIQSFSSATHDRPMYRCLLGHHSVRSRSQTPPKVPSVKLGSLHRCMHRRGCSSARSPPSGISPLSIEKNTKIITEGVEYQMYAKDQINIHSP